MNFHQPVLTAELLKELSPIEGKTIIDLTLGHGGHTLKLLEKGASFVFGFDTDPDSLKVATDRISETLYFSKFKPINSNFSKLASIYRDEIKKPVDAIIADLGLNLWQQTTNNRGFSFHDIKSLDMRLNPKSQKLTAEIIVNTYSEEELFEIFSKKAQEFYSRPLAQKIIRARQKSPIKSATQLADIINKFFTDRNINIHHHPATKIFLALRMAVNQEETNLKKMLLAAVNLIKPGGKLLIISFNSTEDRLIKTFFSKSHYLSTKISPSFQEIKNNPLSRSAILRCITIN